MVRRATLRVGGYVFLLPEQVGGLVEYPFYASVTALSETQATVQSLSMEEPFSGTISLAEIANAPVSKVEANPLRHRELLRQAVWTESAGQFWHGQITGFEGRLARLQLVDRVVLAEPTTLSQVAPVVALLLSHSQLPTATTRDELVEMQTTILARILDGTTGSPASNAIPAILEGLVLSATMPPGDIICRWIYPRTGENCEFRLQHAVNFAFVVDGNQPCPPTLRMSIGPSFCLDPLHCMRSVSETQPPPPMMISTPQVEQPTSPSRRTSSVTSLFAETTPTGPDTTPAATAHPPRLTSQNAAGTASQTTGESLATQGPLSTSTTSGATASIDARILEQLARHPISSPATCSS